MKNLTLDDYVDTFDVSKLDELVKSLRYLSTFDVCRESNRCEEMHEIDDVVEFAADSIDKCISEMLREDISMATYQTVASLPRYSYLLTTAVIKLYQRKYNPFVLPELNLEFLEQEL